MECPDNYRKYSYEDALMTLYHNDGWIKHLILNNDGTFSVVRHTNDKWCIYCEIKNIVWHLGIRNKPYVFPMMFMPVDDLYDFSRLDKLVANLDNIRVKRWIDRFGARGSKQREG